VYGKPSGGWIEVVCGSMFCGKTEELIRRVRRAKIARQKIQVFKHSLDARYAEREVASHNGMQLEAHPVETTAQLQRQLESDTTVIAIDEGQFFDDRLAALCEELADQGARIIVAGLDMDFRGEPFGPMPQLMARAERIDKLQAICVRCGGPASHTQRLIDGRPAAYDDPIIMVGANEVYEARCRGCHQVRGASHVISTDRGGV
jgi:thymidine kinase